MTAFLETLTLADAIGSFGALVVVGAYFATQMRMMNSDDLAFPVVNLLGSVLIVYSLVYNFNLASMLIEGFWILIVTGRTEKQREKTEKWLAKYEVPYHGLEMRPEGEHRHDIDVKDEMLDKALESIDRDRDFIYVMVDDRNSMVKHWRDQGLTCLQVEDGPF